VGFFVLIIERNKYFMKELFDYIEKYMGNKYGSTIDIHTWGDEERGKHFNIAKKLFLDIQFSPLISHNGKTYIVEYMNPTNGRGGMDQGSPETIRFKIVKPTFIEIKDIPEPVTNPDFTNVIALAKDTIKDIDNGNFPKDMKHYIYEDVMTAIFGKDIFKWINKKL